MVRFSLTAFVLLAGGFVFSDRAPAQAFINLDFEQAVLTPVNPGDPPDNYYFSVASALPGWTAQIGNSPVSYIHLSPYALDETAVQLVAPGSGFPAIQGNFSVDLYGANFFSGVGSATASISQTGLVPVDAKSIKFLVNESFQSIESFPTLTLNGTVIPLLTESTSGGIVTLVGDVSSFAGTTEKLQFSATPTSVPGHDATFENEFLLDSISFSPTPAPEPSAWLLCLIGSVLIGGFAFRRGCSARA